MCTNYRPSGRDALRHFGDLPLSDERLYAAEAYPGSPAPMLRRAPDGSLEWAVGVFGLVPPWAKDLKFARNTYNARTETVASKPSFRSAWRKAQFCLVPMDAFYESNYAGGKPVRWRIERNDGAPFLIAGIWEAWRAPTAQWVLSFSLLTVNADGHALMSQFHAPEDEKRSIALAPMSEWLDASPADALRLLTLPAADDFAASADPRPKRGQQPLAAG